MSALKTFLLKIGRYLLNIIRSLRRVICCRKKKDMEYVLPMTIGHITELKQTQDTMYENSEYKSQWEAWPSDSNLSHLNYQGPRRDSDTDSQRAQTEDGCQEDFFKDMVPQIRKQKKIYVRNGGKDSDQEKTVPNRLSMDPNRIIMTPDLGVIDDNPSNWENSEDSEQLWDPDALIREKKRAEQEKRRAEHQRRKQEKENRKVAKLESLSSRILSLSESKDKHKYS